MPENAISWPARDYLHPDSTCNSSVIHVIHADIKLYWFKKAEQVEEIKDVQRKCKNTHERT